MRATTLIAWILALSASVAAAQPKPALVQDRDEPGRNPYQEEIVKSCSGMALCSLELPAVPAGRRLVVTMVTLALDTSGAGGAPAVCVLFGSAGFQLNFEIGGSASFRTYTQPVTRYYEAGQVPTFLCGIGTGTFSGNGRAGIAGYLVTVP
jgi:hypothetical protein